MSWVTEKTGCVRFEVRAKPRAKKSEVRGVRDGVLEVSLAAQPIEGAANAELIETLARALGVPKSSITIVHGATGRNKLVEIAGVSAETVRRVLSARS